jgi:hypothetical protein
LKEKLDQELMQARYELKTKLLEIDSLARAKDEKEREMQKQVKDKTKSVIQMEEELRTLTAQNANFIMETENLNKKITQLEE